MRLKKYEKVRKRKAGRGVSPIPAFYSEKISTCAVGRSKEHPT
jgi:hypothetical protein